MRKCKSKKKEFLEKRENNPQITHRIFQKKTIKKLLRLEWNIDTKLSIRIKRWFVVKQAPSWGGKSQTAPSSFHYAVPLALVLDLSLHLRTD